MDIGIRQLKDGLSRHLHAVRAGHTITVTDHGRPVARIVPVSGPSRLEELIAEGLVTPASQPKGKLPPRVSAQGSVSDLVDEQRR